MEIYYNPNSNLAYVTDGHHLTIHEISTLESVAVQSVPHHLHKVDALVHCEVAHRVHEFAPTHD